MGLTLTSRDVAAFTALQEALLSPLDYATIPEWCTAVLRRAQQFLAADRSAFLLPCAGAMYHVSESVEHRYLAAYRERIAEIRPGGFRYSEDLLERAHHIRRTRGIEVWSIDMMGRMMGALTGERMEVTPVYNEAVKPAGIAHSVALSTSLPAGETYLGVAHSNPMEDRFGEQSGLELMTLLLPAFKAGVNMAVRFHTQREALGRLLDATGQALVLFDRTGRELHRSRRLEELLSAEPEREQLAGESRLLARSLLRCHERRVDGEPAPLGTRKASTAAARYELRATYAGQGIYGLDGAVLVALERLTPALPGYDVLQERYGLTKREAEVAALLAQGLSNREIAERIRVSQHTVRHHAEWVFTKVGIHSRKALGLRLMGLQA